MAETWRIPFVPLGTTQRLDIYIKQGATIYDTDYAGATVLKGGATPFRLDMKSDSDFFTPVRTSTGYVTAIDEDGTLKNKIIPTKENTYRVELVREYQEWEDEVSYDDDGNPVGGYVTKYDIKWRGFVQANQFGNPWKPAPYEISIPINDCLAAAENVKWDGGINNLCMISDYIQSIVVSLGLEYTVHAPDNIKPVIITENKIVNTRDFYDTVYPRNWIEWDEENNKYIHPNGMTILKDICTYFGWTAMQMGTSLYLLSADATVNMRAIEITSVCDIYVAPTENITTRNLLTYFENRSASGKVNYACGAKSVKITTQANIQDGTIFSIDWPEEYEILSQIVNHPLYTYGVDIYRHYSFKNTAKIACKQYTNGTVLSTETDMVTYNDRKHIQKENQLMYGANLICDAHIEANTPRNDYDKDLKSKIILSSAYDTYYAEKEAVVITLPDVHSFSLDNAIKFKGEVKLINDFNQNDYEYMYDQKTPSECNTNEYFRNIKYKVKVGTKESTGKLKIGENGKITCSISFYGEKNEGNAKWGKHADGHLVFFENPVVGPVEITLYTPDFRYTDGTSISGIETTGKPMPLYAILDLEISVAQPSGDITEAELEKEERKCYSELDTAQRNEITINSQIMTPYNYRESGFGILRDPYGRPDYEISMKDNKIPEESLLARCVSWYKYGHEILEIDVKIRDFNPYDNFTYNGMTYYLLSVNYNWRNNTMHLKLINSNNHLN